MRNENMPTTIKLSGEILKKIEKVKSADIPLTTFVREAIERDLSRSQMAKSAETYAQFLAEHPHESTWLKDWEKSRLESSATSRRKKGK